MNRRDFLDTGRAARAAGEMLGPWLASGEAQMGPSVTEVALLRYSRRAMATQFEILLPVGVAHATELATDALDLIDALEAQLTVYRDDSEVSQLNGNAVHGPVAVEQCLFKLLVTAAQITSETSGAFDITSGPLIRAWGFFRRQGRVPSPVERQRALECVGMRHVELNAVAQSVRFVRPGVEINLGSIGKGYALDRAGDLLQGRGVSTALLQGGGSSVLALGDQAITGKGWSVRIGHPWRAGEALGTVHLRGRALGTSAATYQHFEYNKRKLGHLLDPRSGWPAEGIASASVVAPTATLADALATAFYVLGVEKTRLYCHTHPEIGAVLLPADDGAPPVVIGLSPDQFELTAG